LVCRFDAARPVGSDGVRVGDVPDGSQGLDQTRVRPIENRYRLGWNRGKGLTEQPARATAVSENRMKARRGYKSREKLLGHTVALEFSRALGRERIITRQLTPYAGDKAQGPQAGESRARRAVAQQYRCYSAYSRPVTSGCFELHPGPEDVRV